MMIGGVRQTGSLHSTAVECLRLACRSILFAFLSLFICSAVNAQEDDQVTIYFYSESPVELDLRKIANKSNIALNSKGVTLLSVKQISPLNVSSLSSQFQDGETAKLIVNVTPQSIIEGNPLSSYPVTITVEAIGIQGPTPIQSIKKTARSQHTNPKSGFTNAIIRAMESVLPELSDNIVGLEPWRQDTIEPSSSGEKETIALEQSPATPSPQTIPEPQVAQTGVFSDQGGGKPVIKVPQTLPVAPNATSENCDETSKTPSLSVLPNTLAPGESFKLISCYSIVSQGDSKTNFATILSAPSGNKAVIKEDSQDKAAGFWKTEFEINIPERTGSGIYTLIQLISHDGKVQTLEEKMIVR